MTAELEVQIRELIGRNGPIPFSTLMATALSDPEHGFFARGRGAGRAGRDFVTSPEVGPLFGMLVARYLDGVWRDLGAPDPFVVVEAGAGRGRLAADVLRAEPACARALRYVLVEPSAVLREEQRTRVRLEPADEALGPFAARPDIDDSRTAVPGSGPIVTALDDLPAVRVRGVVFANELLDNLPVDLVERVDGGWAEVRVGLDDRGALAETVVPAAADLAAEADLVSAGAELGVGRRLPVPRAARDWIERVAAMLTRGEVVVVDYFDSATSLAARGQSAWLRTYRGHSRGAAPLEELGAQDVTCDVPVEYVEHCAIRAGLRVVGAVAQADWLATLGLDDLVAEGRRIWETRAHLGDLEALAGRSRTGEAAALTDRAGLGAHRVLCLKR